MKERECKETDIQTERDRQTEKGKEKQTDRQTEEGLLSAAYRKCGWGGKLRVYKM